MKVALHPLPMASTKSDKSDLSGRKVEIFLKTPLFRFRYVYDGEEHELLDNAVRLSGIVLQEKVAGLLLEVNVISNMKQQVDKLPFQEVFIPYSKIDFMVVNE